MVTRKELLTHLNAGVPVPVAEQVIELAEKSGCSITYMSRLLIEDGLRYRGIAVE